MKTIKILTAVTALVLSTQVLSTQTLINADALLDVENGKIIKNIAVLIENNKIVKIAKQGNIDITDDVNVVDLKGKTLIPGLMDMHVHLSSIASDNFLASRGDSVPRQTVKAVRNAQITLMAGFTTVRNLGSSGYSVIAVRDGINAG